MQFHYIESRKYLWSTEAHKNHVCRIIKELFADIMAFPAKRITHHILHYIHPLLTHLRETLCHVDFTVPPPRSVKFVQGNIGPRSTPSVTENTSKIIHIHVHWHLKCVGTMSIPIRWIRLTWVALEDYSNKWFP